MSQRFGGPSNWRSYFRKRFSAAETAARADPRTIIDGLARQFGDDAAAVRHEILFAALGPKGLRPRWLQALRGMAALVRDVFLLYRAKPWAKPWPDPPPPDAVLFVATLPGANGWGTLAPACRAVQAAGLSAVVVRHPRLPVWSADGAPLLTLPPPPPAALGRALAKAGPIALRPSRDISALAAAAAAARGVLWREAWGAALAGTRGALVLHNDFDMMSAAATTAAAHGRPTFCLQHGAPTDEFFPARAATQVVWSRRAVAVYCAAGTPPENLTADALGRGRVAAAFADPSPPPAGLALISQSHAPVYGPGLRERFAALADDLAGLVPGFRLLLHPEEIRRGHPYRGRAGAAIEKPPHSLLAGADRPYLTAGFCSTALIDAALAGHYVVGLDWRFDRSLAAQALARPSRQVADAAGLALLFRQLLEDPATRAGLAAETDKWRRESFDGEEGAFLRRLRAALDAEKGS